VTTIRFEPAGDFAAAIKALGADLKLALDDGTFRASRETLSFARAQVRAELGARAANTIRLKDFPDPDKPLAVGMFDKWHRRQSDIPYAFGTGPEVRPTGSRHFLAIPTALNRMGGPGKVSYAAGQVSAGAFVPGGALPGLSANWSGNRRMTPRIFTYSTGLKLRYVKPTGGRRFPLLVVDNARLTPTGRLRGGKGKRSRLTIVAFVLVPQVTVPRLLDWKLVEEEGDRLLERDVYEAVERRLAA
jgi:hypothetical protein